MIRRGRYVFVCPDCGQTTFRVSLYVSPGRVRETVSLVDGRSYPSCRQVEQLCFRCLLRRGVDEETLCMALVRPVVVEENGSTSCLTAKMPPWLSQYPELWEFLSKPSYKDGKPRQLGKVSLQLVSTGVQMTLTDPSSSAYCCRQACGLKEAMELFEEGLATSSLVWRRSGPLKGKRKS